MRYDNAAQIPGPAKRKRKKGIAADKVVQGERKGGHSALVVKTQLKRWCDLGGTQWKGGEHNQPAVSARGSGGRGFEQEKEKEKQHAVADRGFFPGSKRSTARSRAHKRFHVEREQGKKYLRAPKNDLQKRAAVPIPRPGKESRALRPAHSPEAARSTVQEKKPVKEEG